MVVVMSVQGARGSCVSAPSSEVTLLPHPSHVRVTARVRVGSYPPSEGSVGPGDSPAPQVT